MIGILFLIISTRMRTLSPKILGIIIDILKGQVIEKNRIYYYLFIMIGASIGAFITRFIWRYLIIGNSRKLECQLRLKLFEHFQTLPVQFYYERKIGNLMAYAINDINAFRMAFGPGLSSVFNAISTLIIVFISMVEVVNIKLTFITLIPIPIIIFLMVYIGGLVQKRFRIVQENFAIISDKIQENISGIRVIKSYVQEEEEVKSFESLNENMRLSNINMVKASSILNPMIQICFGVSLMISIIYGSSMVKNNTISLGDFIAFNGYITMMMWPVASIGRVITITEKGIASYKRLEEIFEIKMNTSSSREDSSLREIEGNLEIKNLNFYYPYMKEPALKNINLTIKKGETLGIIGKTGSGKTTLINLLLKLYKVKDGMIFIDGKDINEYPIEILRENIGYVPQENILFSSTIKESIHFFKDIYSDEEIEEAAKLSCIYDNIMDFRHGFDTVVGERGTNLSGGQKQRLSIARAIIKDPIILILDDALSAIDTKTEDSIIGNFNQLLRNKTGIIIGHRISAIQHADYIVFMEDGQIIEEGSHEELLELKGRYAEIYEKQFDETKEVASNEKQ